MMLAAPRTSGWLVLAVLIAVASGGQAAEAPFTPEAGYVSLFDGKDLKGWYYKPSPKEALDAKTETPDQRFEIKDGILVANAKDSKGKGGIKDLYTVKEYNKDFHLKLEFRAARNADSGVYIRGKQLQVRDYPRVGPYKPEGFKDDDWNELDIDVKGTKALCKCNGVVLETAFAVPAKGGIGLQAETGKFEFRRIRVKEE